MKPNPGNFSAILLTQTSSPVPALIAARGPRAGRLLIEFFTVHIPDQKHAAGIFRAGDGILRLYEQARLPSGPSI